MVGADSISARISAQEPDVAISVFLIFCYRSERRVVVGVPRKGACELFGGPVEDVDPYNYSGDFVQGRMY